MIYCTQINLTFRKRKLTNLHNICLKLRFKCQYSNVKGAEATCVETDNDM